MEQQQRHPHAELLHLWAEGAEIEMMVTGSAWVTIVDPSWSINTTYRVKPKLVKKTLWVQVWNDTSFIKNSKYVTLRDILPYQEGAMWHKVPTCTKLEEA